MMKDDQTLAALQQENAQLKERVAALEMKLDNITAKYMWLEGMLEQSHLPICYWHGPNQVYRFANSAYLKRTAKPDAVGKPLRKVFAEEEVPGLMGMVELAYTSGKTQTIPSALVWLENEETGQRETLWYDLVHSPVRNQQGKVIGVSLIAVDVTEQQQQAVQIRQSQEMLHTVIDNLPQAVFWKDRALRYLGCNQRFARDAGLSLPTQIVGKSDYELPGNRQAEAFRADDLAVMEQATPRINYEEKITMTDGSQRWLLTSKIPLYREGEVFGVLGLYEDITERKQTEENLRIFKTIIENSSDAIGITNMEGVITYSNPAHRALFRAGDETVGMHMSETVAPEADSMLADAMQEIVETGSWIGESLNQRQDGSTFPVEVLVVAIRDDQGAIIAMTALIRDISERKQQEVNLHKQADLFNNLIQTLPFPVFYKDAEGVYIGCNQLFADNVLGLPAEAIVGKTLYDLLPAEAAHVYHQADAEAFQQGGTQVYETEVRFADGLPHSIRFYKSVFHHADGTAGGLIGAMVDISERKQAEAERIALQQQVIAAQQAALREISTPLIPITDTVVIMPLVGTIDSTRAQQVLETLLEGVAHYQAELAILDITGVQIVDTQVAQALVQAARAVRLLGAQVMLTGIQPQIAQTLVHLGVDLGDIITRGSLQAGIAEALRQE